MDGGSTMLIVILILLICGSAFFSASETALTSLSRIRLRNMVDEKVKNADITGTDPRLYVEVSMYSCTKDDNLTLDNYRNYNWDYPVSQMYFPLCGEVEGRSNTSGDNWVGAGFSSYGSAVLYATSTGNSALHVKITGDNPQNQYMSVISDEIQTNAKQIRLVKTQN